MWTSLPIFSPQFSIFSLFYFQNFLKLLRCHEIFHSSINNVFPIVAMRRQWVFLLGCCIISGLVYVKYFFISKHYILIPPPIDFGINFCWLSSGCSFWNYWNLSTFNLLKANFSHCLRRILLDLPLKIIREFLVSFSFGTPKKSFCFWSRIII